jgi:hypothetical protein
MPFNCMISDFDGLAGVCLSIDGRKRSLDELFDVFMSLPYEVRDLAYMWSCDDIVFKELAHEYLVDKLDSVD